MKVAVTTLAFCVAALLALGLVMLYSSSMNYWGAHYLKLQLIWCTLGLICCVAATALDYRLLKPAAWPVYLFTLAMLVLVLLHLPHGITGKINGAHRWLRIGSIMIQPSELGKIALIVLLARYCDRYQRHMHTFKRGVLIPGMFIAPLLGLVFIEPDRGGTILLGAVCGIMLLMAGVRWRHFFIPAAAGGAVMAVAIVRDPLRMNRIMAWIHPQQHLQDAAGQAQQAMIALGAGGWTGLGLGNGRQKLGFLPLNQTDFIFPVVGEELGLIATLLILAAFVIIALCGLCIAVNSRDTFGSLLAVGFTSLITLQAAINIGVATGALPNKGLPLPFISYGGSNLLVMLASVGVLLSIARRAPVRAKNSRAVTESDENPFAARAV